MARHVRREPGETGAFWPGVARWLFWPARDVEGRPHIRLFWLIAGVLISLCFVVAMATGSSKQRWNGPEWVILACAFGFVLIYVEDVIASARAKRRARTSSASKSHQDESSI